MMRPHLLALGLLLAAASALAQTPPGGGILQAPPKNQPVAPQVTPSSNPPKPAPVAPVQQVAPMAAPSLLGHSAPGKPPPVVQPQKNTHAAKAPEKPPAKSVPGKPAPATTAKPAAPPPGPAPAAVAVPTAPPPPEPDEAGKGKVTGQPLPRWASLRSDEVNLRAGPGTRYPVEWVYRRRDVPVEIEREFDAWRLIVDQDGVKGWVHSATLVGRRSFVVKGKDRVLRRAAADDANAVAILKPGVVGRVKSCEAGKAWCEVQVSDYRGWLRRDEIWGVFPAEAVN